MTPWREAEAFRRSVSEPRGRGSLRSMEVWEQHLVELLERWQAGSWVG